MTQHSGEPEFNPNAYDTLFARFEEKLDNIATNISELKVNQAKNEEEIKAELKELKRRISVLEAFKAKALGAIAVVGAVAAYFWHKAFEK